MRFDSSNFSVYINKVSPESYLPERQTVEMFINNSAHGKKCQPELEMQQFDRAD